MVLLLLWLCLLLPQWQKQLLQLCGCLFNQW
jgi:hypothetical protein